MSDRNVDEHVGAADQLRANIRELMKARRMTQAELADKLGRTQPWVSKRMSVNEDYRNKWTVEDLDALTAVFQLAAWELLTPGHGRRDRRKLLQRRTSLDRRHAGGFRGASDRTGSPASELVATEAAIDTANHLYGLAERMHALANAILGGHAATLSDASPSRLEVGRALGQQAGGPGSEKAG